MEFCGGKLSESPSVGQTEAGMSRCWVRGEMGLESWCLCVGRSGVNGRGGSECGVDMHWSGSCVGGVRYYSSSLGLLQMTTVEQSTSIRFRICDKGRAVTGTKLTVFSKALYDTS
jgi:hypothetical protein